MTVTRTARAARPTHDEAVSAVLTLPTINTDAASVLLGCWPQHLQKAHREGTAPVRAIQVGSKLRWPSAPLRALLGLENEVNA